MRILELSLFAFLASLTALGCKRVERFSVNELPQPQVLQETRSLSESDPQNEISSEGPHQELEGEVAQETASRIRFSPYQLGDEWNRLPTPAFHENHATVLRGAVSTETGLISSNFIFLKKMNDLEGLFVTTLHSLPACNEEGVVLYSKEKKLHGFCSGVFERVPETDSVIVSIEFFEAKDLNGLIPVRFSRQLAGGERVRFFGIESDQYIPGYFPLVSDASVDCLLLSSEEKRISDPDTIHPVQGDLWSLAVSCDIQHGDSGGMIVNRSNELLGVVWTGAFPKKETYSTLRLMQMVDTTSEEVGAHVWSDMNYAVPAYRIQAHLQAISL